MGVITFKMPDQKKFDIIIERLEELENTTPLMKRIAGLLRRKVARENFKEEGRPVKWTPLSAKYGAKKEAERGKETNILIRTGILRQSIANSAGYGKTYAQVSTNLVYAAAHHFGYAKHLSSFASVHEGLSRVRAKGVIKGIPARPFMTITDEDKDEITEEIRNHIARKNEVRAIK
jgi:phage virion morphogenesis protein